MVISSRRPPAIRAKTAVCPEAPPILTTVELVTVTLRTVVSAVPAPYLSLIHISHADNGIDCDNRDDRLRQRDKDAEKNLIVCRPVNKGRFTELIWQAGKIGARQNTVPDAYCTGDNQGQARVVQAQVIDEQELSLIHIFLSFSF